MIISKKKPHTHTQTTSCHWMSQTYSCPSSMAVRSLSRDNHQKIKYLSRLVQTNHRKILGNINLNHKLKTTSGDTQWLPSFGSDVIRREYSSKLFSAFLETLDNLLDNNNSWPCTGITILTWWANVEFQWTCSASIWISKITMHSHTSGSIGSLNKCLRLETV